MKKHSLHIFVILMSFMIASCGSGAKDPHATGGEGSVGIKVTWVDAPLIKSGANLKAAAALDCSSAGVSKIEAKIFDVNGNTIGSGGPWDCSTHTATISHVPAGTQRKAVLAAKDTNGVLRRWGEQSGATINADVSNTIEITAAPFWTSSITPTVGNGQVFLNWTSVTGATSYNVYWSTSSGVTKSNGNKLSSNTNSYPHTGLTNGTTYYYVVTAVNSFGEGQESTPEVSGTPSDGTPTNPTVIVSDATWKVSSTGPTGWTSASFDDTGWINASIETSQWGPVTDHIAGSSAAYIWTQNSGDALAYLRKTFTLSQIPSSAVISIFADDDYELYVNGSLIATDDDCTWNTNTTSKQYDVAGKLSQGQNVIAVRGKNCGGPGTVLLELKTNGNSPPTCTYTYSDWSTCQSGTQTRTVISSSPAGCTPGTPVLSQPCTIPPSGTFKLPDTGQSKCYQGVSPYAEISCAGTGQDGAYNINPMSYTDNGNGTVTDNVTGLMWQKQDDGTTRTWDQAVAYCDGLTMSGCSDWRLPSKRELMSIVDYSIIYPGPTINMSYFPNTKGGKYYSSVVNANGGAWSVYFGSGYASSGNKSDLTYARCVRGAQNPGPILADNHNGTVSDNTTGLMWQKGEGGAMQWAAALDYCEGLPLAGYTDWHLPNIKELASLSDDTRYNPAIDTGFFPSANALDYYYCSSTNYRPYSDYPGALNVWFVYFSNGGVGNALGKDQICSVRCVRGGQ